MRFAILFVLLGCGTAVKEGVHKPTSSLPLPSLQKRAALPRELLDLKKVQAALKKAFLICAGDTIQIRVVGHDDLVVEAVVPVTGEVSFPRAGRIKVVGRSPQEIEDEVASALRGKEFVDPQVVVTVTNLAPRRVFVLGAVKRPGAYQTHLARPLTLTRLIALAGGFLDTADREGLSLLRRENGVEKTYTVPFTMLRQQDNPGHTILLLPGDVVIVPERQKVYVLGSVASPGGYVVEADTTLSNVLALAGGLTRLADPKRVRLIRRLKDGTVRIAVFDMNKVFEGKLKDVVVAPGDVIFVPESLF